ncbi:hypothetical protein [Anaerotignum sp. MB30-C6]|uniref:hypothetical protein n=1 Tax=Anaerotignum sp. MB30-C6 TaxID=3070814 RepID=UPI0027DDE091|nr:hypothetical protein [Anaerotignum sp. MB30-C6]WMI81450.1 hypothetical protein RBQ60_01580 [Anaerotignum sp. MB30-C6]
MKKKLWLGVVLVCMAFGVSACGDDKEPTVAAESVTVDFVNQTGEDVGILRIRPAEEYDWSENLLEEEVWKQNYEMPVSLSGVLPEAEEGWQVQMKFLDGSEETWQGVDIQNNATAVFSFENGLPNVEIQDGGEENGQTVEMGNVTE